MIDEVQKHKHIRIKFWENILLFISDSCLSFLIPHKLWHKKKKLVRLLNEGRKRIEKELDIVKILKSLRDIKILMKNSLMTPKNKISNCSLWKKFHWYWDWQRWKQWKWRSRNYELEKEINKICIWIVQNFDRQR